MASTSARVRVVTTPLRLHDKLTAELCIPMLERHVALAAIDRAIGDAALERPWLTTSVLTAAVRALGSAGHISLIPEVLNRAATHELGGRALPGRQRVYNEAARMLARDTRSGVGGGRVERVLGILERMRTDRVAPSSYTLQHVFAAARREPSNEPAQLLKILQEQMRAGMRPNRASFDALIEACAPAAWASTAGRQLDRLPLLLIKTCEICQVTPSGQTVGALLRLVHSPAALTVVEPLVAKLPFAPQRALRDDALVAARARVHAAQTADAALVTLRMRAIGFVTSDPYLAATPKPKAARGDLERRVDTADGNAYTRAEFIEEYGGTGEWEMAKPVAHASSSSSSTPSSSSQLTPLPPPAARRALLLGCVAAREYYQCVALLDAFWGAGLRVDERTCRRLLHESGEGVRRRSPGALALLQATTAALLGDGLTASVQRGGARRTAAKEHELVRVLARAEWRAKLRQPAEAQQLALSRLARVDVAPRPRLLATLVHMHAASGDFGAALRALEAPPGARRPAAEQAAAPGNAPEAADDDVPNMDDAAAPRPPSSWLLHGAPALVSVETPYLALLSAVRSPTHLESAIEALKLMALAGVRPTLRTRIALARMAGRLQTAQEGAPGRMPAVAAPSPRVPGAARFWGLESVGATPGGTRAATAGSLPVAQWLELLRREEGRRAASGAADESGGSATDDAALVGAASDLILESRMAAHLERIREIMESNVDVVRGLARSIAEQDQEQRQQVAEEKIERPQSDQRLREA